jgi:predicted ATPase
VAYEDDGRHDDLPAELTSFVGREAEVAAVHRLLAQSRLVTLTGPGGVGKTRIALHVAADMRRAYADGVCLVELSALQDAGLLSHTVAAALGLPEQTVRPAIDVLVEYLKDRQILLVLDTCEHIIDGCSVFVDVLRRGSPRVHVLATSRQPLSSAGEHVLAIAPMAVPEAGDEPFAEKYDAMVLFGERAAAALPGFAVTEANWDAVAAVCRRLDGIPLAIELAAVRLRALSLDQVVSMLDDRFQLLTGGVRGALPRHQTLRTTIGWSHELCTPGERLLWARLSVFAADFDRSAVEWICAGGGLAIDRIFERLINLVEKSIVVRVESDLGTRYRLLDTIREYGREWLAKLGEEVEFRGRHCDFYHAMSERFEVEWLGSKQVLWCRRLNQELPNLRVALEFCIDEEDEAVTGLGMVTALWGYWLCLARFSEACYWLDRALVLVREPLPVRARALWLGGWFRVLRGDYPAVEPMLRECRALAEEIGDESSVAYSEQYLGSLYLVQGKVKRGLALYESALARLRKLEDRPGLMILLFQQGFSYILTGDVDRGLVCCAESLALNWGKNERLIRGYALYVKALGYWMKGEYHRCGELARTSLRMRHEVGDLMGIASGLEMLGWVAAQEGRYRQSAYLLGAAQTAWQKSGTPLWGALSKFHAAAERRSRQALGADDCEEMFRAGRALTLDQAVGRAMPIEPDDPGPATTR